MTGKPYTISSWVNPTNEDVAYFRSLPVEEQEALFNAEIEKGFVGEAKEMTPELMDDIWNRAMERVKAKRKKT